VAELLLQPVVLWASREWQDGVWVVVRLWGMLPAGRDVNSAAGYAADCLARSACFAHIRAQTVLLSAEVASLYRGTPHIRNSHPPRTTIGS